MCAEFKRNKMILSSLRVIKFCFYQIFETTPRIILSSKEELF